MKQLRLAGNEPFDVIFIDAEKEGYPEYLDLALPMLRTGGLILADNTLPYSLPDGNSESVITRFNQKAAASPELISTVLPIIRDGGIDGLLVAIKCADRKSSQVQFRRR
jgi:predicted O-methyltransferase YrrM